MVTAFAILAMFVSELTWIYEDFLFKRKSMRTMKIPRIWLGGWVEFVNVDADKRGGNSFHQKWKIEPNHKCWVRLWQGAESGWECLVLWCLSRLESVTWESITNTLLLLLNWPVSHSACISSSFAPILKILIIFGFSQSPADARNKTWKPDLGPWDLSVWFAPFLLDAWDVSGWSLVILDTREPKPLSPSPSRSFEYSLLSKVYISRI